MKWRDIYLICILDILSTISKPNYVLQYINICEICKNEETNEEEPMNIEQWTPNEWQVAYYLMYVSAMYVQILHLN